jgi:hypothetical protein
MKLVEPADGAGGHLPSGLGRADASDEGGWLLWLRAGTLVAQPLDVAKTAFTGEPMTLAEAAIAHAQKSARCGTLRELAQSAVVASAGLRCTAVARLVKALGGITPDGRRQARGWMLRTSTLPALFCSPGVPVFSDALQRCRSMVP